MIVIGVGEIGTTNTAGEYLKTFALGSCVALIFLHPSTRTIGMAHIALWNSSINPRRARSLPGFFADTAIPLLISDMKKKGVPAPAFRREVLTKIVGGANVIDPHDIFKVGQRNAEEIKKILTSIKIPITATDIGKEFSRTVTVYVDNGAVVLSSPGKKGWQL